MRYLLPLLFIVLCSCEAQGTYAKRHSEPGVITDKKFHPNPHTLVIENDFGYRHHRAVSDNTFREVEVGDRWTGKSKSTVFRIQQYPVPKGLRYDHD